MKNKKITVALLAGILSFSAAQSQTARLQVIHNAADPGAATVDVYVAGNSFLNDFSFREATPFQDVPAGIPLNVAIAPSTSTSASDAIFNQQVTLVAGETYILVARGVITPGSFAANPESASTAFTLDLISGAKEAATNPGEVEIKIFHNATDAPAVDVLARDVATLVNDAPYPANTAYIVVPPADYIVDITPAADNTTIVGSWTAPLSGFAGKAISVLASGFLTPSTNQNGEALGLIAVFNDGTVIPLPSASSALVQIVHNSADPAAASVDVYLNGSILKDNFAFRTATGYLPVPAGVELSVAVAPPTSTSVADSIATFPVTFANGKKYIVFANGVLNAADFAGNPDLRTTGFGLYAFEGQRTVAATAGNVEFRVFHGATDAPTVDALAAGTVNVADNAGYTDMTGYTSVPPAAYTVDVTPGADNSTIIASYYADLSGAANATAVIFASGFLNPAANQNGPAFGLYAVLGDGTVFPLDNVTGINTVDSKSNLSTYPVPAANEVYISGLTGEASVKIVDISGREVINANVVANRVDISSLVNGIYTLRITNGELATNSRIVVSK